MRWIVLVAWYFSIIAFIFSLVTLFAGVKPGGVESAAMATVSLAPLSNAHIKSGSAILIFPVQRLLTGPR